MPSKADFDQDLATPIAQSQPIVRLYDDRHKGQPIDRDIDSKFHASSDYAKYDLSDYTVAFVEATFAGSQLIDPATQHFSRSIYIQLSGSKGATTIRLSDLDVPAYKTSRRQVKKAKQCESNFHGEITHGNICVTYNLLEELCLVVIKDIETDQWKLATHTGSKNHYMGCSDEHYEIGHYVHKRDVKVTKIRESMNNITIKLRSIDDPAVQASILTQGTYNIGMDASLKLMLSTLGILISIGILCYIGRDCVAQSRKEN